MIQPLAYVRITDNDTVLQHRASAKLFVDNGNSLDIIDQFKRASMIFLTFQNETIQFAMQPINPDPEEMFDSPTQVNVLHNISGLVTKRTVDSNQYKIVSAITKEAEQKFYQRLRSERFSLDEDEICGNYTFNSELPTNAKLGKYIKTLNGYVLIQPNQKVFIPAFLMNSLSLALFLPAKFVPIEGHAGAKEQIWLEFVYKETTKELFLVMFGLHTSQVYYARKIQNGIENFCGLDWDGRYIYTLVETNQASCSINNEAISLWLLRYDLMLNTTDYFPVQYYPIEPYGIKIVQNLLLIAEPHGTVVCELINSRITKTQEKTTTHYPFQFYALADFTEPARLYFPFDKTTKLMSVNEYSRPETHQDIVYNSIELKPTSLDKFAYLLSFDRPNLLSPGEVIARQYQFTRHFNPIVAEFLYIYPFRIVNSFVPKLLDSADNPVILSQNDLEFKISQLTTVQPVYEDAQAFKSHISAITSLSQELLERSQTTQLDNSYPLELKLVDNVNPVQAKIYQIRWFYEDQEILPYLVYNTTQQMPDAIKAYFNNQVSNWNDLTGSEQITSIYGVTKTKSEWREIFKPADGWFVQTTSQTPVVTILRGVRFQSNQIDTQDIVVFIDEGQNPTKAVATLTIYWLMPNRLIIEI